MIPDDLFTRILSELWFKIVQPILNGLAITVSYSHEHTVYKS